MSDAASQRKMWGARFDRDPDASFYEFERSWKFDRRLLPQEFALDRAWARAIARAGILTNDEGDQLVSALDTLEARSKSDPGWLDGSKAEDVHHFLETALIEKLGALGAKLHTGRSRNDMVATEFRMYVKDAVREIRGAIALLEHAIAEQAERNLKVPMPGSTHMQHAQPLLLSHWLLAHGEAFHRDAERVAAAAVRADVCPLGSGALSGCAFPLDRKALAHDLGFASISANSLDAVSDRDFALEYLFALSTLAMHLSRLSEDFVLFASPEFGFVELPDEFSTGSSLMPQKKNPDAWELIRGKTGRIYGSLMALFVTMKGLPSSYQRDLQEDKENLFQAHDQALSMVHIAAATLAASKFREDRLRAAAQDPALVATELADYLVTFGVPFREAHEIVGKVLRAAEQEGKSIREMSIERLKEFSPVFDRNLATALTLESAIARRSLPGGTAPGAVQSALQEFKRRLAELESDL
jgi:argininosuccinate lyase